MFPRESTCILYFTSCIHFLRLGFHYQTSCNFEQKRFSIKNVTWSCPKWVYMIKFDIFYKKKLLFWVQATEINHFSLIFNGENPFLLFHTHDLQGSKQGLKCLSMVCKHYYALFRTKWRDRAQKVKKFIIRAQVTVQSDPFNFMLN